MNSKSFGTLSNYLKVICLEFEDQTDERHGRYSFSFDTEDSEGASVLDYDGTITVAAKNSRMDDEIEWGQNVPEDWEGAEKIVLDAFYDWMYKQKTKQ